MDPGKTQLSGSTILERSMGYHSGRSSDRSESVQEIGIQLELEQEPEPDPLGNELTHHEHRRERHGESLWRALNERQINMIAFSGAIGNGLFLGGGRSLALAGPGGAVLSYVLIGSVVSAVISSLGEMTALMPVNAPVMEFPRRFLDRGVAFAVGWIYWFAFAVIGADELVAATNSVKFLYDDGRTHLEWTTGQNVDGAVWIFLFVVLSTLINMLPVKYYGNLEYIFGCIKLIFIVLLIVVMLILDVMQPRANAYYTQPKGTQYWDSPYTFFKHSFNVKDSDGHLQRIVGGSTGTFLGMWLCLVHVVFSYVGVDMVAATAAESKALMNSESMKMGARKICIRVITLYVLATLTVSFLVPSDHPFINGKAQSTGASSAFVIAVVEAGLPNMAHFFNAIYVLSSFTCATSSMYVASRVLHTLALQNQTGPDAITSRLRLCRSGVPVRAVFVTGALMLIGFMGRTGSPGVRLGELASNCTVSFTIVYAIICVTYLRFFKTLEEVKMYGNASEAQAATYDRNHPRYAYKSHGQWLKACYGMVACFLLLLFNGIDAFLKRPFDVRRFITSYIGIPVFFLLIIGYKIRKHGLNPARWAPERSNDLRNAVQTASSTRKGRLEFPDESLLSVENAKTLVKWIWVWMK